MWKLIVLAALALPGFAQVVQPETRLRLQQVRPPAVTEPRLMMVIPVVPIVGAEPMPLWVAVKLGDGLVLDTSSTTDKSPVLRAVSAPSASIRMEVATWGEGGLFKTTVPPVLVVRNGLVMRRGVDYEVVANGVQFSVGQGFDPADSVLVLGQ